jgi:hypothetical protein
MEGNGFKNPDILRFKWFPKPEYYNVNSISMSPHTYDLYTAMPANAGQYLTIFTGIFRKILVK